MSEAMLALERQFDWIRAAVRESGPKSFVLENTVDRDETKATPEQPFGPVKSRTYTIRITAK